MSLQHLFDHLDDLVRTPEDVARLEAAILDLAVRGKLVRQEEGDERAEELVARVQREASGNHLKTTPLKGYQSMLSSSDMSTSLPAGWYICRTREVCSSINDGDHIPPPKAEAGVPFLVISNIRGGKLDFASTRFVPREYYDQLLETRKPRKGDVLCSIVGSIGTTVLIEQETTFCFQRHLALFRPTPALYPKYLLYLLQSPLVLSQMRSCATGIAQLTVPLSCLRNLSIPLPPLAEQRRIVAKVEELLAQTRALAANLRRAQGEIVTANQAALHRLASAEDGASLQRAWHTLAGSFDLLYDDPRPLAALRQAILQLAVRGKLVRQEEGDEPAEELVRRISLEHGQQSFMHSVIKVQDTELPLPATWMWMRFSGVATIATNGVDPANYGDLPHIAPDNIEKFTGRLLDYRTVREDGVTSVKHYFRPGHILYSKIRPNLSKVVLVDFEGLCSADMYPIASQIDRRYLHFYMLSDTFRSLTTVNDTRVAMPKINQNALARVPVPVPPLAEQRRIVAKVDELLAMCDALEQGLGQAAAVQRAALEAVLARV